ncbi:S-adenosyl-L-methionine-dependent methyltransferase [Hygrophoropsis aurantiaca]|uniref:S-adenosyl-L-methionine-dependent methyltransferase n=1 Tax=Hygrophoropsis aurantiaca TaxID=72124 RepID=A0ACB8AF63_9AGAM|nr:S-adenosyl-L-methionine-dependent methyltransferase [Hygrophoropsis aurantiaca]
MQLRALDLPNIDELLPIGGLHLAFTRSCAKASIVKAFDWDQTACQVYEANYGPQLVSKADISTLTASYLSPLHASIWLLSPSCQPYTVLNPNAKGTSDPRAKSFFHLIDTVLPDLVRSGDQPRYMLVENVAGFQDSTARTNLVATLTQLGYSVQEFLLSPLQFGIPNSRLRYYLLAKFPPLEFNFPASYTTGDVLEYIPGQGVVNKTVQQLKHYLDMDLSESDAKIYKISDRILTRWGRLFDIVVPSGTKSCCFTRGYTQLVERSGSILQMNELLNTTTVFNNFLTLLARGDTEAVRELDQLGLRYFSPSELLRLLHFVDTKKSASFNWPPNVSLKSKYRLIGNSVNVEVVRQLINYLLDEPSS